MYGIRANMKPSTNSLIDECANEWKWIGFGISDSLSHRVMSCFQSRIFTSDKACVCHARHAWISRISRWILWKERKKFKRFQLSAFLNKILQCSDSASIGFSFFQEKSKKNQKTIFFYDINFNFFRRVRTTKWTNCWKGSINWRATKRPF